MNKGYRLKSGIIAVLTGIIVLFSASMPNASAGYVQVDMFTDSMAVKGIQGVNNKEYNTKHRLLNLFVDECYHTLDEPFFANGYILPYEYKGKKYALTVPDHIYYNVREANRRNESVSIVFLMRWSDKAQWLIDDAAREPGHAYYALETEGEAGEWLEAFFSFFCEEMGSEGWELHVDNFILGNEVNMPNQWNYFGTTNTGVCSTKYADAFRIMYNVVRRYSPNSRCSISLDHSWNHNDEGRGIAARDFLTNFAQRLNSVQPGIDWCVSAHLYPAILYNTDIWNSDLNGLSYNASFVDGKNLYYMTNYIKENFGEQHRVMLTEQGFSDYKGPYAQAASLAYSYYAAMYDPMVDSFILNNENSGVAAGGQSLNFDISGTLAGEVYKKIGNGNQADQDWIASVCLPVIGVNSWAEIIPYFGETGGPSVDYSLVFDAEYYAQMNPDLAEGFGRNEKLLLNHFINTGMNEGRIASKNFNVWIYRENNQDLVAAYGDNLKNYYLHYISNGYAEGRIAAEKRPAIDYSLVFDAEYYSKMNPDLAAGFGNNEELLLNHFINAGMSEGRVAKADFNVHVYREKNKDLIAGYGDDLKSYYLHYISYGYAEGRIAAEKQPLQPAIDYSLVFDSEYYSKMNPDLAAGFGNDEKLLLNHFVSAGMSEGRIAKADFNVHVYREKNPDLAMGYGDDLKGYYLHYISYGYAEGRIAAEEQPLQPAIDYSLVFDAEYYSEMNPDLAAGFGNDEKLLLNHFVSAGMSEGRVAKADFNVHVYREKNPDLAMGYGDDLKGYYLHYISYGYAEGRIAAEEQPLQSAIDYSLVFDAEYYSEMNPDLAAGFGNDEKLLLEHFINAGMSEGRIANKNFNVWVYRANSIDLWDAYGDEMEEYYIHYILYGYKEYRKTVE